jgi:hypothetical protein
MQVTLAGGVAGGPEGFYLPPPNITGTVESVGENITGEGENPDAEDGVTSPGAATLSKGELAAYSVEVQLLLVCSKHSASLKQRICATCLMPVSFVQIQTVVLTPAGQDRALLLEMVQRGKLIWAQAPFSRHLAAQRLGLTLRVAALMETSRRSDDWFCEGKSNMHLFTSW